MPNLVEGTGLEIGRVGGKLRLGTLGLILLKWQQILYNTS